MFNSLDEEKSALVGTIPTEIGTLSRLEFLDLCKSCLLLTFLHSLGKNSPITLNFILFALTVHVVL